MATITLSELLTTGFQLFQDSESFLNDLSDVDSILGGGYDYYDGLSNYSVFNKLIEGFVDVYAIGHIADIAKSFSNTGYFTLG
jgi:hypothetical protein